LNIKALQALITEYKIAQGYSGDEPLDGDAVATLAEQFKIAAQLQEGNITPEEHARCLTALNTLWK